MIRRRLRIGDLVVVAAAAAGSEPVAFAAATDVTLLAMVADRARRAPSAPEATAAVLVGAAAGRPFPSANSAAAWALAAHVADLRRCRLRMASGPAVALVRAAASGDLDEGDVAAQLAAAVEPRDRLRDLLSWLTEVRPAEPSSTMWACPRCGRAVSEPPFRSSACLREPLPADVVADCAARHRGHTPDATAWTRAPVRPFELVPA